MKLRPPRNSRAAAALVCAALLALAGCGAPQDEDPDKRYAAILPVWDEDVGEMSQFLRAAVTENGERICVISDNGNVSFLNTSDGERRRLPIKFHGGRFATYTAGAGCLNEVVAAVGGDGWLRVYDATEGALWHKDIKTRVFGAPLLARGKLFALGLDGRLLAYTMRRGRELWRYVSPLENIIRTPLESAVVIDNETVYAGVNNGLIVALDQANGQVKWESIVSVPRGNNEIANILDVMTPAVGASAVCASAYQSGVACFSAASGERLWHYRVEVNQPVVFDAAGRHLYTAGADGRLYAHRAADGELLWRIDVGVGALSKPAYVNGMVLVGDRLGFIYAFFADTGELGATFETDNSEIIHLYPAPAQPDTLYALTIDGQLSRLRVET